MIRIHFYYPETAAQVKRFVDSVFMAQNRIYVSDLCILIEKNWHDALVNSKEIRDIIEKFRGCTWHRDSIMYDSDFITFNGSVFSISEPCMYPTPGKHQKVDITNCNRYQPKTFKNYRNICDSKKEEKKMIAIQCKSADTAKAISDIINCQFEQLPTLEVDDLIKHIRAFYYTDLWYPSRVDYDATRYKGKKWYKDNVRYYYDGTTFFISEPEMTQDQKCCCEKKEEEPMRIDITGVNYYNDRVVIVRFSDGTFTKSVCSKNDTFDLDIGISLCLLKKMMADIGAGSYPNLIRRIHKIMDNQEWNRKKALEEKAERRKLQEERRRRNIARAARKAKETYGDAIREAVAEAMKEASK